MENNTFSAQQYIRIPLFKHQISAYNFTKELYGIESGQTISSGVSFLMEMGTGKTLTSIAVIGMLADAKNVKKVLVVSPLSVIDSWHSEVTKYALFKNIICPLYGNMKKKEELFNQYKNDKKLCIFCINYESMWRMYDIFEEWKPELVIADESHKIKEHKSKVSKYMHKIGCNAQYKIILTGTIITNRATDVFSQYKFVNSSIFGSNYYAFQGKYFYMGGYGNHIPFLKKNMENELIAKMHSISFVIKKEECLDLPETTTVTRNIFLPKNVANIYNRMLRTMKENAKSNKENPGEILRKILRLSQLTGGFQVDDEKQKTTFVNDAKINALEDIIDTVIAEDRKVVVVARFTNEINLIVNLLKNKKIKYSILTGKIKNRGEQISSFQEDPDIKVFVGQIQVLGLGITLTAASNMVFYSMNYSMSDFEQTRARIHRAGQKYPCTYFYLVTKNTVDERIVEAIEFKKNIAKALVDDFRRETEEGD